MKAKHKTKIIIAIIGLISAIIGTNYGRAQQKQVNESYNESQFANINGNNNSVVINSVDDLVNEYNKLLTEHESLKNKNTSYFEDLTNIKHDLADKESQLDDVPQISYNNLSLVLDGTDLSINNNNSMVIIDGREYFSKEIVEKLLSDNKNITIKDNTIFIGKVISDKAKLSDKWVMNRGNYCSTNFTGKDSYGNARSDALLFSYYGSSIVYNLNREYSYLKCTISIHQDYSMDETVILTISPDNANAYSVQLSKTTEPYEIEIPINNCSLLTIETDSSSEKNNVIISDAVLYN